ncbi:hypothetical protein [Rhizobium sp. CC-YZS058]|uniref:hypothetical protein n=1 Tax=Rhizobium sp. CC-YZS058 TaxID=3042153 RepID=UPI002B060666|nr:hypothetical protein [Rhizobium sp. CC-YZS058]MEA3534520.1 hypothetical protein [Rhizobium sp. CC-YZS058]
MSQGEPSHTAKRAALDAVLSSDVFARSERLRAFLTYVVEKDLAGEAQQLKGYTIAIDVFGRAQSFNADSDPLVRVHAGKLRKLLTHYYESEGATDPWQIVVPKGGYTPSYSPRPVEETAPALAQRESEQPAADALIAPSARHEAPIEPAAQPLAAWPSPLFLQRDAEAVSDRTDLPPIACAPARSKPSPFAALSILPLMMLLPLSSTAMSVHIPAAAMARPGVVDTVAGALPHLHLKLGSAAGGRAQEFSRLLSAAFTQYRTINATTLPTIEASAPPSPDERLSFDVTVEEQSAPDGLMVTIANSANGDVVSSSFIPNHEMMDENDLLYESLEIASTSLTADGAIFRYAAEKGIESHLMRCMRLTDLFRMSRDRRSFQEMRDCQQGLVSGPDGKMIFAISAGALPKALSDVK